MFYVGTMYAGDELAVGDSLASSNGKAYAVLTTDGIAVLTHDGHVLWTSAFDSSGDGQVSHAVMLADGNFGIYKHDGQLAWDAFGHGWIGSHDNKDRSYIMMQDDGNLVIYWGSIAQWQSKTAGFIENKPSDFQQAIDVVSGVADLFGFTMFNTNFALLRGQDPIAAIKKDVANAKQAGKLAELASSGDYKKAWLQLKATSEGSALLSDTSQFPAPPGYTPPKASPMKTFRIGIVNFGRTAAKPVQKTIALHVGRMTPAQAHALDLAIQHETGRDAAAAPAHAKPSGLELFGKPVTKKELAVGGALAAGLVAIGFFL